MYSVSWYCPAGQTRWMDGAVSPSPMRPKRAQCWAWKRKTETGHNVIASHSTVEGRILGCTYYVCTGAEEMTSRDCSPVWGGVVLLLLSPRRLRNRTAEAWRFGPQSPNGGTNHTTGELEYPRGQTPCPRYAEAAMPATLGQVRQAQGAFRDHSDITRPGVHAPTMGTYLPPRRRKKTAAAKPRYDVRSALSPDPSRPKVDFHRQLAVRKYVARTGPVSTPCFSTWGAVVYPSSLCSTGVGHERNKKSPPPPGGANDALYIPSNLGPARHARQAEEPVHLSRVISKSTGRDARRSSARDVRARQAFTGGARFRPSALGS